MEYPSCHIRGHTGSERQISQTLPGQNEPLSPLPWRICTLTQITRIFSLKISQPGVQASSGDAELAYQGMLRHHEINRIGYRDSSLVLTHLWNSQIATFMTFPPTLSGKCSFQPGDSKFTGWDNKFQNIQEFSGVSDILGKQFLEKNWIPTQESCWLTEGQSKDFFARYKVLQQIVDLFWMCMDFFAILAK